MLDDATVDRIARRVAHYLRQDNQARVDRDLAEEHRRQVPLTVIEAQPTPTTRHEGQHADCDVCAAVKGPA